MNWKQIDENWKSFIAAHGLELIADENNYFYGYRDIYKVVEGIAGYKTYYENKFNKSGAGIPLANSMSIITPINNNSVTELTAKRNSFFSRVFKKAGNLKIQTNLPEPKQFPAQTFESLITDFPDLSITVANFEKYQHQSIPYGQKVVITGTKRQPTRIEHLEDLRKVHLGVLKVLGKVELG